MVITIENVMAYLGVLIFVGGLVTYVLNPLRKAIEKLQMAVDRMNENMAKQAERLVVVEQIAKSAHKRIDEIINEK